MKPPDMITRYFNAVNAGLINAAHDCFSPDAAVLTSDPAASNHAADVD